MKTVEITVDIVKRNDFSGGFEVILKSNKAALNAFINDYNTVTVDLATYLHSLFTDGPYTSDFVKKSNLNIQKGFKNWNPSINKIFVEYP